MKFSSFFVSKGISLSFIGIGVVTLSVMLYVANASIKLIAAICLFIIFLVSLWLVTNWMIEKRNYNKLKTTIDNLKEKYLLGEVVEKPRDLVGGEYYDIMKEISRSAIAIVEDAKKEKEDYYTYVEGWIHEIKTPLTACNLILSGGKDYNKLKKELKYADNLTESILYYAKLRTIEKDTKISKVNVATVIDNIIKNQMDILIAASISIETKGDFSVYTDSKQLSFILGQLLVNCSKYCKNCHIDIVSENGVITVTDNGPGIASHELSRVTDKGFSGAEGRKLGNSTGMGLYIVSCLCKQLDITLKIESELNQYTSISLLFDSLTKM